MTTDDAKTYLSKREIPRLFESLMTGLMYHRPGDHIKYLIDCLQKVHDKGQDNITWSSFVDIRRSKTPLPPISNDRKRPNSKGGSRPTSRTRTPKGEEILNFDYMEDSVDNSEIVNGMISHASDRLTSPLGGRVTPPVSNRVFSPVTHRSQGRGSLASIHSNDSGTFHEEEAAPKEITTTSPLPAIPTTTQKLALPDIPIVLVMGAPGSCKDSHVEGLLTRYPGWKHLNMGPLIREEIVRRGEAQSKWKMTNDLLSRGEVAPEDVTIDVLLEALKTCKTGVKGVVVTGFPRSLEQVTEYEKQVGRADCVFMIDCEENAATERLLRRGKTSNRPEDSMTAIANRMNYFKANTLAAAKYYDDQGKLVVIDGDAAQEEVLHEIGKGFDKLFFAKFGSTPLGEAPPKSASSTLPEASTYKGKYEKEDTDIEIKEEPLFSGPVPEPAIISEPDNGRKPGLPDCPIIFVAGGPGSGKGTQCARVLKRYPEFVHISMGDVIRTEISEKGTADDKWGMISTLVSKGEMAPEDVTVDLLKQQLEKHKSAKAFLIEGFPRDKNQVETFNRCIGGLNFVMLFDCEEYYMQTRLMNRGKASGRIDDNLSAIANRIKFYKYNTLPVLKYYDDIGKLVVLDADRDMEEMFFDISQLFDFAFFGERKEEKADKEDKPEQVDVDKAASKIQAGFRGYMVRSGKSDAKKRPKTDEEKLRAKEKISGKPKAADGLDMSDEKTLAAQKIAAGFHGLKLRHDASEHKNKSDSKNDQTGMDKDEAMARIQAGFIAMKKKQESLQRKNASMTQSSVKSDEEAKLENQETKQESVPVQEEVIEATITAEGASTTGNNVENPSHTQELDEAGKS